MCFTTKNVLFYKIVKFLNYLETSLLVFPSLKPGNFDSECYRPGYKNDWQSNLRTNEIPSYQTN
jgi:hypothetical protein